MLIFISTMILKDTQWDCSFLLLEVQWTSIAEFSSCVHLTGMAWESVKGQRRRAKSYGVIITSRFQYHPYIVYFLLGLSWCETCNGMAVIMFRTFAPICSSCLPDNNQGIARQTRVGSCNPRMPSANLPPALTTQYWPGLDCSTIFASCLQL